MRKTVAILIAMALCTIAACTARPVATGQGTPTAGSAGAPNELVLAIGDVASGNFDPKQGWGTHGQIRLTHSALLAYDTDLALRGDLASKYEVSPDGLTWTFPLRKGVKFSDGTEVTAADVAFTYQMLKDDKTAFDLSFLTAITTPDSHTVVFTLDKPRTTFTSPLVEIGIVPKASYGPNYSSNPIGSGPYKVVKYTKDEQLILEANPYFEKKPQFTKLTFLLLKEDAAVAAARAGKVDVAYVPSALADQPIKGMALKSYESVDGRGISLPTQPAGGKGKIKGVEVPVGNDVTSDVAIRKALAYGLDRKKLIDVALAGHAKPAYSLVDGMPWFNKDTVIPDGDGAAAKKLLADGGWTDTNNDGIVEKNGRKASFKLMYNAKDQLRSDLSLATAQQAKKLGIEIEPVGTTWDEIYKQGKVNTVMWGGGRHNPTQLYSMYSSKVWDTGYNNMPQYKNPTVDAYLDQAIHSADPAQANDFWKKAQWDGTTGLSAKGDAPIVWLVRLDHLYFVRDGIDLGKQPIHSHGHEWQLFGDVVEWRRT